ncbi:hypothetical protein [Janthinobacterium psychrotolerans]|uniref:EpsG family protein n=1 Tax=Janthinobacterium psychrotolerans TaxID=1747903 RepID=A0A1A7C7D6_9BURK|nr:hypothetical protein [Janthinobacterium psychrotolerans]OBV40680.1 hypothetical protein ASR47_101872 [Janthinobacterium psychrotolerans]
MNLDRLRWQLLLFSLCVAVLLAALFLAGGTLLAQMYHGQSLPALNRLLARAGRHPLDFYIDKFDTVLAFCLILWTIFSATAALAVHRLQRPCKRGSDWLDYLIFAFYTAAFLVLLAYFGSEERWYVIDRIMAYEGRPPFLHRVLFIFPAQLMQYAVPQLGAIQAYLGAQLLAVVLLLWAVRRLASLFIRRDLAFIGQALVLCMWAPTLSYYTFYDIGIIFVFAFCLYHLLLREWLPYLLMLVVGTFNHEITLFLVVVSGLVFLGTMRLRTLAGLLALQLALYALARLLLFHLLPTYQAWESGKPMFNLHLLQNEPRVLFYSLAPLLLWYALAATGYRHAPQPLRRCLILLPCLLVMTTVVGQFNESRQFDAFIPVAMALMLCSLGARLGVAAVPSPLEDSGWRPASLPVPAARQSP